MSYCLQCGADLPANSEHCTACGHTNGGGARAEAARQSVHQKIAHHDDAPARSGLASNVKHALLCLLFWPLLILLLMPHRGAQSSVVHAMLACLPLYASLCMLFINNASEVINSLLQMAADDMRPRGYYNYQRNAFADLGTELRVIIVLAGGVIATAGIYHYYYGINLY